MRRWIVLVAVLLLAVPAVALAAQVGDQRQFWGWDLSVMPPADRQFDATCRGVGEHGYVWVEDAVANDLVQADVDAILATWDTRTPAGSIHPDQGSFAVDTGVFGDPPDVDSDPKIHLLYYDIGSYQGYTFDGFFRAQDEEPGATSNLAEVLHLNSRGPNAPASDYMLAVAAHEFTHAIIYHYDKAEADWVQEALAEAAMTVCGYYTDQAAVAGFAANPQTPLIPPSSEQQDYGAALLFGTYLYERFGEGFLRDLVVEPKTDISGIQSVLDADAAGLAFADLFGEWTAANAADLPSQDDGRWGYTLLDPPVFHSTVLIAGQDNAFAVPGWATQYFRFGVQRLDIYEIAVDSTNVNDLRAHVIEKNLDLTESYRVDPIPTDELSDGFQQTICHDGAAMIAVAHAAAGASAEGMLTATLVGKANADACGEAKKHKKESGCGR